MHLHVSMATAHVNACPVKRPGPSAMQHHPPILPVLRRHESDGGASSVAGASSTAPTVIDLDSDVEADHTATAAMTTAPATAATLLRTHQSTRHRRANTSATAAPAGTTLRRNW